MGHSGIQITVDTYGHLIPGADIAWVDRLDSQANQQPVATRAQPRIRGASQWKGAGFHEYQERT
jgi:hypothetical protein